MKRLTRTQVTFSILTKASEPLVLDDYTKEKLTDAFERAVQNNVDLRYYPESRHIEERHSLLGVEIVEG